MSDEELEQIIEKARIDLDCVLCLSAKQLTRLPDSIGTLPNLKHLYLRGNKLTSLPESIGNLSNLTDLDLSNNLLVSLPDTITKLYSLTHLNLSRNNLINLPESIENLSNLTYLKFSGNQITHLSESICKLSNLRELRLCNNQLSTLPERICNLSRLTHLDVSNNRLIRLPQDITNLYNLCFLDSSDNQNVLLNWCRFYNSKGLSIITNLSRYCCTAVDNWRSTWLLDEENTEIRRILVQQIGYEKICNELEARELDIWREYTLLSIELFDELYDEDSEAEVMEQMLLLKMTCPSTGHIHVLRVPPEMTSAESAITWVNHGIHPDEFAVQT